MIGWEDEALQSDAYIEALLAAQSWSGEPVGHARPRAVAPVLVGGASAGGVPGRPERPAARDPLALDDELALAAGVLGRGLVRFHPSFRFEEALLSRLRMAAAEPSAFNLPAEMGGRTADDDRGRASDARATLLAMPVAIPPHARPSAVLDEPAGFDLGRAVERMPLPVLAASAIASGVSIAGAAYVAWRRTRRPT